MTSEEKVINYYTLCNRLKYVIRTGWKHWNVSCDRLESVAEHIYGVQMLAIAIKSEYDYDVDIMKVIYMLAIHELGETIIGDLTLFDISKDEKEKIEHEAVHNILKDLIDGNNIEKLFLEFDSHETKESIFAYMCDKLECDIQCKLYDQNNYIDINNQSGNVSLENNEVLDLLNKGNTVSQIWTTFSQNRYPYDKNFKALSNYIKENDIKSYILK